MKKRNRHNILKARNKLGRILESSFNFTELHDITLSVETLLEQAIESEGTVMYNVERAYNRLTLTDEHKDAWSATLGLECRIKGAHDYLQNFIDNHNNL